MATIIPGTECPVCGKRHRADSAPLAACMAKLAEAEAQPVSREITPAEAEAVLVAWAEDAEAPESREARWTEKRGDSGRYWTNGNGWVIFRTPEGFDLRDLDDNTYGVYGLLSWAIDASEGIDQTEWDNTRRELADLKAEFEAPKETSRNAVAQANGVTEAPRLMDRSTPLTARVSGYLGASATNADNLLAQGHDAHYVIGALIGAIKSAQIELDVFGGAL